MTTFRLFFICGTLMLSTTLMAQVNVSAIVQDAESKEPMMSASAVLLDAQDSSIVTFAIASNKGQIVLRSVEPGSYILNITFLGYETFTDKLIISDTEYDLDLGVLEMSKANNLLQKTVIKGDHIPIQMNKDTLVYNANAFKTKENASVEDLLKKMPGIEVEDDGTIKAQGEEVKQVLVDGKEFFGNDPKIATKNLPAKAVDKVEVFDKKSDQAQFSGIDDGDTEKAINLELKEEYKEGYFGNAEAGGGTEGRSKGKVSVNRFDKKQQISVLGQLNNVNEQGFSFNEYVNFMGGASSLMRSGGRRGSGSNISVPINDGLSTGFVETTAGGINYNRDLSDKLKLRSNYFYNRIATDISEISERQYFDDVQNFNTNTDIDEESINAAHRANITLEYDIDSTQNLKLTTRLSLSDNDYIGDENTSTFQGLERRNTSESFTDYNDQTKAISGNLIYRKKLKKAGRSYVLDGSFGLNQGEKEENLSTVASVKGQSPLVTNQEHFEDTKQNSFGISANFTEPLGKSTYLGLTSKYHSTKNKSEQDVFDIDPQNVKTINDALTTDYDQSFNYYRGGPSIRWIGEKSNLSLGVEYQFSEIKGEIENLANDIYQDYHSILPNMKWSYEIQRGKRLSLNYRTSINEPSVIQLQPLVDNSDPLNIYVGNPTLDPEYRHNVRLRYFSFSQFNLTSLFATVNLTYTKDKIANSSSFDQRLVQTTTPVNINDDYSMSTFVGGGAPIRSLKIRGNVNGNIIYQRSQTPINSVLVNTDRITNSGQISIENMTKDFWDWSIGYKVSVTNTAYDDLEDRDQQYNSQKIFLDLDLPFAKTWNISSSFDYNWYNGDTDNFNDDIPIWKAALEKQIFSKRATLSLSVFDILNQNLGISQNNSVNYIEESQVRSLGRYAMLSLNYQLSKLGSRDFREGFKALRHATQ